MQLQGPHTLGAAASANGGIPNYNAVFANMLCDDGAGTGVLATQLVIFNTSPTSGVGLLGHSVEVTTSADSPLVAGVAHHDAADGDPVLVQISGVAYVTVLAAISAAGEAVSTSATAGSGGDATDAAGAYTGELPKSVAGISLQARSATITGQALCKITCG